MDAESPNSPPPPASSQSRKSGRRKRRSCRKNGGSGVNDSNIPNSSGEQQAPRQTTSSLSSTGTNGCYISSNEETEEIGSSSIRKTKRRCPQLHSLDGNKEKGTSPKSWSSLKSSVRRMDSISSEQDKALVMASPSPMPMTTSATTKGMKGKQSQHQQQTHQRSDKPAVLTGSLKRRSNRA